MAFDPHKNLAYSVVATAPSPATSGTTLTVGTGAGSLFPQPSTAGAFNVTIWPTNAQPTTANAEIVRCTARSGDVLTITRAQEGTSARSVGIGDQIALTVTAKIITDIENRITTPGLTVGINVKDYGAVGDVTTIGTAGTDDTAAFNAALAALPTVNGHPAGKILMPAGIYRIDGAINNLGPYVSMEGEGAYASILDYRGSGDCLRLYTSDGTIPSPEIFAGRLAQFSIDGTGSSAGAVGLHAGDVVELELDILIKNFAGVGSIGYLFDNTVYWTEKLHGRIVSWKNDTAIVFTVTGTGANSFAYSDLSVQVIAGNNGATTRTQRGIIFRNGAYYVSGRLSYRGYFSAGAAAGNPWTPAALEVEGFGPVSSVLPRGFSKAIITAAATLTIPTPERVQAGDVMVAVIQVGAASALPATPAGWTLLDSGATGPSVATYYKVAGSSEPSSYSWTLSAKGAGVIGAWSGVDNTTPIDAHGALNRTVASTTITATTITPSHNGCTLVFVAGIGATNTSISLTGYNQDGWADDGTTSASAFMAEALQQTAAATGAVSATITSSGANAYCGLIALKPAAAAAHLGAGFQSAIELTQLDIQAEVSVDGGSLPVRTIRFGSPSNSISGCQGIMGFTGTGTWKASNYPAIGNTIKYLGIVKGDANINSHNDETPVAVGGFNNP